MSRYSSSFFRFTLYVLLAISLASCSAPAALPTSTAPAPTQTAVPSTSTSVPTATATLVPAPPRPQYTMNVVMDYNAKSVSVDQTIVYPNHTGQTLNDLVIAVEPNYWQNCFMLTSLAIDDKTLTNYTLNDHKLSFQLSKPLAPESVVTVHIQYTLALPPLQQAHGVRPQIFGYSQIQMNLTDWYPFVVPNMAGQWILHDHWYYGEHLVYDAADYDVNLKFTDPANAPIVASSGAPSQNGEWTRYTLTAGRTFVISASREYKVASAQIGNIEVNSYYFPFYEKPGAVALNTAMQAIQVYSQRFGPYSHQTFSVVMGDFNDGMEFSGFVFLPRAAYNDYDGKLGSLLVTLTAHETAHQWWFEQVADDQALQPWLDEAMASYSEHIFYESVQPDLVSWWWAFWPARIYGSYQPQNFMDISIYNGQSSPSYISSVYVRGAHFLDDLRTRIGDQAFFAFLQDYLKQENGRIATAADFFRILRLHTQVDFSDLIKQYFQNSY